MQRPAVIAIVRLIAIQPQAPTAIDRVDNNQLACEVRAGVRWRKLASLWDGVSGFLRSGRIKEQTAHSGTNDRQQPGTTHHDNTSEIVPLLSANLSVGTSIF